MVGTSNKSVPEMAIDYIWYLFQDDYRYTGNHSLADVFNDLDRN